MREPLSPGGQLTPDDVSGALLALLLAEEAMSGIPSSARLVQRAAAVREAARSFGNSLAALYEAVHKSGVACAELAGGQGVATALMRAPRGRRAGSISPPA